MKTRKQLKLARVAAGHSQKELASIIGVSQQTIAKWELGITTPSHFTHLRLIESALEQPADLLFPDIFEDDHCIAE